MNRHCISFLPIVLLTAIMAGQAFGGDCQWTSLGPTNVSGRITGIVINPRNPAQIFVTSVGGLWRSDNWGRGWQRLSDEFIGFPRVLSSVVINPLDPNEVFVSGGDPNKRDWGGGVWRSGDNGNPGSWHQVGGLPADGLPANATVIRLRINPRLPDPGSPNDLFAATESGVYVRNATSGIWSRLAGFDSPISDMVVDFAASPPIVYVGGLEDSASFRRGIWKYDGAWAERDTGIPREQIGHVALAMAGPDRDHQILYAKIARRDPAGVGLSSIYKTTTAGNAWQPLSNITSWQTPYNNVIEVDPSDASIVWVGDVETYRWSGDPSGSFIDVNPGADPGYPGQFHADNHAIAFDPSDSKIVYVGTDGGIFKSTDTSKPKWHWINISHGMVITEFYNIALQQSLVTLLAGGSQDNGSIITYGNRAWYEYRGSDSARVAVDAANSSTVYGEDSLRRLFEDPNPVGYSVGGRDPDITWDTPTGITPINPLVTDSTVHGAALSAGTVGSGGQVLLKTTDGVRWRQTEDPLVTLTGEIKTIAIGPLSVTSTSFRTYYVGVFEGNVAKIWRSFDGGRNWEAHRPTTIPGSTGKEPSAIAIDPTDHRRAFAAIGRWDNGVVLLTTDGGNTWNELRGTGSTALPNTGIGGIVIDQANPNDVYVATRRGVFRGRVSRSTAGTPDAAWEPFNEGIPNGIDVYDIWSNAANGLLYIGTFGYGVYERNIGRKSCPATMLVVRDCVMDPGFDSPNDVPDPEHPIPDTDHPGFYKPDDTAAGRLYWWQSTDIRIDVPSSDDHPLDNVDSVEFETCPIEHRECPPQSLKDSILKRGEKANAYVQVTNRGSRESGKVRVILLRTADATTGLPDLPSDFWTRTFPRNPEIPCGSLTRGSGWTVVDTDNPCRTIKKIEPAMPEVVGFNWTPMFSGHTCMMAIIESARNDDPIPDSVRDSNETRVWKLAPGNRQIAVRNLHIIDVDGPVGGGSLPLSVPNPDATDQTPIDLYFSKAGMPREGTLAVLLPPLRSVDLKGMRRVPARLSADDRRKFRRLGLDTSTKYELFDKEGIIWRLPIPPRTTWKIGLLYDNGRRLPHNSAARFSVLERQGRKVLGGSVYILRF